MILLGKEVESFMAQYGTDDGKKMKEFERKNISKTIKLNDSLKFHSKSEINCAGTIKREKKRTKTRAKVKTKIIRDSSSFSDTSSGNNLQNCVSNSDDSLYRQQYQHQHQQISGTLLAEVCPMMIPPLIAAIEFKGRDRQG